MIYNVKNTTSNKDTGTDDFDLIDENSTMDSVEDIEFGVIDSRKGRAVNQSGAIIRSTIFDDIVRQDRRGIGCGSNSWNRSDGLDRRVVWSKDCSVCQLIDCVEEAGGVQAVIERCEVTSSYIRRDIRWPYQNLVNDICYTTSEAESYVRM